MNYNNKYIMIDQNVLSLIQKYYFLTFIVLKQVLHKINYIIKVYIKKHGVQLINKLQNLDLQDLLYNKQKINILYMMIKILICLDLDMMQFKIINKKLLIGENLILI